MALKIRLKPHEKMIVNGAVIAAGDQAVVLHFLNKAAILLEKDVLTEQNVVDAASRLYFILQLMYIDPPSQPRYAEHLPPVVEELAAKHPEAMNALEVILELAAKGDLFKAMRLVKKTFDIDKRHHTHNNDEDD